MVSYVLFCKFLGPLSLQGASSNFLVLGIKAHKIIRVSCAWMSSQLWERGTEKVAFVLLVFKSGYRILHSHQQRRRVLMTPKPCSHLGFAHLFNFSIWGWCVRLSHCVFINFSSVANHDEYLCAYWLLVYLLL